MSNTQNTSTSRLEIAALRLERAMQKVETAIEAKDLEAREDTKKYQDSITSLQADNNNLKEINQKVSSRIDSTIDKLSRLLEG